MYDITGTQSDSSVLIFNKIPFIDIKYPVVHINKNYSDKKPRNTSNDIIQKGINFYSDISRIDVKSNSEITMYDVEMNELISALKGGVIYNGD